METLTASSVSSRPWVLQFFRNLFGSTRHVSQERQPSKVEAEEKEAVGGQLLDCPLGLSDTDAMLPPDEEPAMTELPSCDIHEDVIESHIEGLSLRKDSRFRQAIPRNKKLSDLLRSAEVEKKGSEGLTSSMISQLVEQPGEGAPAAGEKKNEPNVKEIVGKNEVLQDLQEDEGVSMVVDSMADVKDCSVEEEKEHLLKEDEQTEPPKAEVSPWNRLINMYKQRRRLPASKVTHQVIPPQPLIEDEATLDLMIYGMAAPKAHVTLSNSSGADCAYGLPETEARENAGDCEVTEKNAGSNDEASLEHPKNVY
ncbi:uncharacterized protein LOC100554036 [Anolis carolinensis]|uniref:uncharacterized protein LOC100554036 n=1 Tax=Anolis carolinensis TaxID=28377 RepID=UPI000203935F